MIVDALDNLERVRRHQVALLTPSASPGTMGYQLDMALAAAGERGLTALALYGAPATSLTAIRLADRARVALLTIDPMVELTDLAFGLARLIRTDPGEVLARALEGPAGRRPPQSRDGTEAVLARRRRPRSARASSCGRARATASPCRSSSDGRPDGYVCLRAGRRGRGAHRPPAGRRGRPHPHAGHQGGAAAGAGAGGRAGLAAHRRSTGAVGRAAERARDVGVRLHEDLAVVRLELAAEPDRDLVTRRAMDEELDDLVLGGRGRRLVPHAQVDGALLLDPRGRGRPRCRSSACSPRCATTFPGGHGVLRRRLRTVTARRGCGRARRRPRRPPPPRAAGAGRGRPCTSTPSGCRRCSSTGSARAPPGVDPAAAGAVRRPRHRARAGRACGRCRSTWTSAGRWPARPSACTCTATPWPTGCGRSASGSRGPSTWTTRTAAWSCSWPAVPGCSPAR